MSGFRILPLMLLAIAGLIIGCQDTLTNPSESNGEAPRTGETGVASSASRSSASKNQDLAALRRATAPFHNFEKALAAEYDDQLTPCLEDPVEGGQGFHYGNEELIDGEVELTEPELLLYEPHGGGSLRLVGVEYIVPIAAWMGASPPMLFEREFHQDDELGLFVLHVWAWRHNPSGLFADWNPKVSCGHPG